jgi:N-hydroxyarylamine O-acetyltransferase
MLPGEMREAVLDRLGFAAAPAADPDGLARLYAAWGQQVPWDSAQKRVYFASGRTGPLPGSSPIEYFEQWLRHGTGGTCWSGSFALRALLVDLGFDARVGGGQVCRDEHEPLQAIPNHGTVIVRFDRDPSTDVIVDSSFLTGDPVRLPPPDERRFEFRNFRPQGGTCWRLLLDAVPLELADAWHEATRPSSPFNRMLAVRRNAGDDIVGWSWGQGARLLADGSSELVEVDRTSWLVDVIGFSEEIAAALPEDELVHA